MTKELLNILREVLLTFDDNNKQTIINRLSKNDLQIISEIERSFLTDTHINKIIEDFGLEFFQEEIKDLHAEFYLELAEMYAEGKSNKKIEKLLESNNQTFKKAITLFPNESTFLKELSIAMDDEQTEKLIGEYAKIDEWLESKKSSQKAAANVIPIKRIVFRYAIAAAVVGVLIGGAYLRFFNNRTKQDNSFVKNDSTKQPSPLIANIEVPNIIESKENNLSIILNKTHSGFAGINESLMIKTNGLSKQIDTLRTLLEKTIPEGIGSQQYNQISKQIDSLMNVLNTYTYDVKNKRVALNVPKVTVIENVISIEPNNLSKLYFKIEGRYYLIENTKSPLKLMPVTDKKLIQDLRDIEFINE